MSSSAMLGRGIEIQAVRRVLDRAPDGPQTLLIEGEAGIGKTTIWLEAIAAAGGRGMAVLSCRCVDTELGLPFTALADLLADLPTGRRERLPEPQQRALDVALLQVDPEDEPPNARALGSALLGLLRATAARSPVLVAIDDPPWMDASSARVVAFALRRLGGAPVTLLLARRTPATTGGLDVAAAGHQGIRRLHVGPVSVDELSALLRSRTGHRVGRPEAERIHAESGGNPFYALEIATVGPDPGAAIAGRAGPLPDNLSALVGWRVGAQPAAVRGVLLLAAAASRPTRTLLENLPDRATAGALDQALDQQLLLGMGERLRFAHPLLANAAYWDSNPEERRRAHQLLSEIVPEEDERSRHAALAVSGPDAGVAATLDTAARNARKRGAPEYAAELLETALLLTPTTDLTDRERRTHEAADARFHAGDSQGALRLLDELVASTPTGQRRAAALARMARIRYHDESLISAVELLEEALPQADGAAELQATIRRDLGWARASIADLRGAEADVRAAARLLPAAAAPELTASIWAVGAVVRCLTGHGADLDVLAKAEELQPLPAPIVAFDALSCRAQVLKWTDQFDGSRRCYQTLRRRLIRHGEEGSLPFAYFQESELECWAGRWDEAAELSRLGRQWAELTEQSSHQALCAYVAGLVDALRGRVDSARAALTLALMQAESITSIQAWAHTGLGFLELSLGEATAARQHLAPFADMASLTGLREPGVFRCVPDLVEALLLLGDVDGARPLALDLEERGRALDRPYALATGARCRGLVATADGCWDDASAAFGRALVAHQRLAQPFELARTLLAHGVMLRRTKQRAAARERLETALAGFDRLGARLWSERTRVELVRVGGASAGDELTPTEMRIAELVCAGPTNREVASTLSISVKTVEVNLTRIYRKLGVRSRTELAHSRGRSPT